MTETCTKYACFCRTVEPRYASTAGMFGAASIVTGIFSGIGLSYAMPALVSRCGIHTCDFLPIQL